METISERLEFLMRRKGLQQSALAERIGVSQQGISDFKNGKIKKPRFIVEISNELGAPPEWIMKGKGEPFDTRKRFDEVLPARTRFSENEDYAPRPSEKRRSIPVYGVANGSDKAAIGNLGEIIDTIECHDCDFAVYMRGESMLDKYPPGCLVLVEASRPPKPHMECIIENVNGDMFLKVFERMTDKEYVCRQLNPAKEWRIPRAEVKALHYVKGVRW